MNLYIKKCITFLGHEIEQSKVQPDENNSSKYPNTLITKKKKMNIR